MNNLDKSSQETESEIAETAKNVDANQIKSNLKQDKSVDKPEDLTEQQKTPFIDDKQRTDK